MSSPPEVNTDRQSRLYLLRRRDQQFIAAMVVLSGLLLLGWWWQFGGRADRLIEWDETPSRTARFEVNVNTAGWPELTQLPEIGETLGRRIVGNREIEGPFGSRDDLTRVHGIGEKTLDQMRPYLSSASWPREVFQGTLSE